MSLSAYDVAAVFRLTDEFSGPLRKIAAEVAKLEASIKRIGVVAKETNTSVADSLRGMGGSINRTTAEVDRLAAAWGAVKKQAELAAQASRFSAPPTFRSGVGPGSHGSRGGGVHYRPYIHAPGGHIGGGSGAALLGAGAAAYSVYESLEVGDIVSRGLASVYPEGLPTDADSKRKELMQAIIDEARITKLPLKTVAKMALDEIKTNAGQSWQNRMKTLPLVIESAAREGYLKDTDPEAATSAFVGQLHQIRAFSPEEIEKYGPMIAYFASKDPNSLTNIGKSGGYHTPIGTSLLGIPIEQDLAAQTVLDRTGVGGKSGTWLREMVTRAAKPVHDKNFNKKIDALKSFGLADDSGSPTWMSNGAYDEQKLLHIINERMKGVSVEDKAGRLKQIFGERGSGAVALLTEDKMLKQYDEVLADARAAQSNTAFWNEQNKANPTQRMKGALVDAQIAALAAGQILTPPAVGAASGAASVLGWGAGLLPEPNSQGAKRGEAMGAGAAVGGIIGGVVGVTGGPPGILGGALLGGALGADAGYLIGTFNSLDTAAKGAADALKFLWKYGPGAGGRGDNDAAPKRMNFIPPPPQKTEMHNVTSINIDGQQLARIIDHHIAQDGELPDSSDRANGVAYGHINAWNPRDG
jgi:TP901 family phage tail tape measure protein